MRTTTKTQTNQQQGAATAQPIARLQPSRLPIVGSIAKEFNIEPHEWRVLVDQIFPNAKTVEAVGMAIAYCRARKLDIFKRPVHIVPMWSTALGRMVETVWPGISEIRTTAHRTGEYAGIDAMVFGDDITGTFEGVTGRNGEDRISKDVTFPEWASVTVYRWVKGQRVGFNALVYWEETYATIGKTEVPNEMWAKRPRGQLMKCVEAAALRMAFPEELGNTYAAEEMEGRTIEGNVNAATAIPTDAEKPKRPTPPPPPEDDEPDPEPPAGDKPASNEEAKPEEPAELQKSDQPEGGENEADEFNAIDFLNELEDAARLAGDVATLEEVWDTMEVETKLGGSEFMADAEKIIARNRDRLARKALEGEGQGSMFGGDSPDDTFPGDLPFGGDGK